MGDCVLFANQHLAERALFASRGLESSRRPWKARDALSSPTLGTQKREPPKGSLPWLLRYPATEAMDSDVLL